MLEHFSHIFIICLIDKAWSPRYDTNYPKFDLLWQHFFLPVLFKFYKSFFLIFLDAYHSCLKKAAGERGNWFCTRFMRILKYTVTISSLMAYILKSVLHFIINIRAVQNAAIPWAAAATSIYGQPRPCTIFMKYCVSHINIRPMKRRLRFCSAMIEAGTAARD